MDNLKKTIKEYAVKSQRDCFVESWKEKREKKKNEQEQIMEEREREREERKKMKNASIIITPLLQTSFFFLYVDYFYYNLPTCDYSYYNLPHMFQLYLLHYL